MTQWVDADTSRVTHYGYDWREPPHGGRGRGRLLPELYYDNLDNLIRTEQYDGRARRT